MPRREIRLPDLGTDEPVDVVEVLVGPGDRVEKDDGLLTLESDKASMDLPSPAAGRVVELNVRAGDRVKEGDLVLTLDVEAGADSEQSAAGSAAAGRAAGAGKSPRSDVEGEAESGREVAGQPAATAGADGTAGARPTADSGPSSRAGGGAASRQRATPNASGPSLPRQTAAAGAGRAAGADSPADPHPSSEARHSAPGKVAAAAYDAELVVVGGGPGGYTAAFRAADLGLAVTLVERYPTLGGVCLNVGCIPSKALLHVARVMAEAAALEEAGVAFGEPRVELAKLRAFKQSVVARLTGGLAKMAEQRGVRVVRGTARLAGPHALAIDTGDGDESLSFGHAILATGSRPVELPGFPHEDPRVWDSTDALALERVPERLLLVGGGIVGLEMAMVYGALGAKLTIVELLEGIIPGLDRDLVRPLERRLVKELGAEIHAGTRVESLAVGESGLAARFAGPKAPESGEYDAALVAVGRRPNGDLLNAAAAGLPITERGFVAVDRQMRTAVPHLFAIGDLVGHPMLAHKASHEGKVAAEVTAGGKSAFDARAIPNVAYTDPEIAWVGLTEEEAKKSGTPYEKAVFPWAASGRALGMARPEGRTKLLFDPETRRLLGAGIVGPGAGDLISEAVLALEMDAEAADLALTIHPHPTLSETVGMAAEVAEGVVTDLYLKR